MEKVISCDGHIVEPLAALPAGARYEGRSKQMLVLGKGYDCPPLPVWTSVGAGAPGIGQGFAEPLGLEDCPGAFDPLVRAAYCELKGVRAEILYPTFAGVAVEVALDEEAATQAAGRYNGWARDFATSTLHPLCLLPAFSPLQLTMWLQDLAGHESVGVVLPQRPREGRWRDYIPAFRAAAVLGLPVHWHAFTRPDAVSFGKDPLALAWEAVRPAQDILLELILGGVFKEVPGLKVVFAEFDIGWVPHFAVRLKRLVDKYGKLAGSPLTPVDVYRALQQQCYFVCQSTMEIQHLGHGLNGLWGWDYPHADAVGVPSGAEKIMRELNARAVELYPRLKEGQV